MAVDINLLEISFNADDSILAYDAPYGRLRNWSEGRKSGRMFIYLAGHLVIKNTSSSCKQLELDLVLFIVQLGATGPPRYTLVSTKIQLFYQSTIISNLFDKSAVLFA